MSIIWEPGPNSQDHEMVKESYAVQASERAAAAQARRRK